MAACHNCRNRAHIGASIPRQETPMPPFKLTPRVAAGAAALLLTLFTVNAAAAEGLYHTVKQGDTLTGIAGKYDVPIEVIVRINHIADPNLIIVGHVLEISEDKAQPAAQPGDSYAIQPGDTLSEIALV